MTLASAGGPDLGVRKFRTHARCPGTRRFAGSFHAAPRSPRPLKRKKRLKEQLRALYHLDDPAHAEGHLDAWLAWAQRSKLKPFVRLARTLRRYRDGILAAITLGLTNARLEGLHSKVRLLSHRSFGFHSAAPLIALIYLCCAGITINPPLR